MGKVQWCDNSADHSGPFFTVTAIAVEAGPDSRRRNRGARMVVRKILRRLCDKCLLKAEFRFKGEVFGRAEALDPADDS